MVRVDQTVGTDSGSDYHTESGQNVVRVAVGDRWSVVVQLSVHCKRTLGGVLRLHDHNLVVWTHANVFMFQQC